MTRHPLILGFALLAGSCVTDPIPLGALNASVGDHPVAGDAATSPVCGNGVVEEGEACDDGQTDNCGDCNADCTGTGTAPVCGDGDVCVGAEACDDGFTDDCGTCNADCTGAGSGSRCGDGVICPQTEVCDDGDRDDCNGCNSTCSAPGLNTGCVVVGNGTFDPDQVYLWGTLSPGSCSRDAIAHWSTPNTFVVGFGCGADSISAVIQPIERRLLYTNPDGKTDSLRSFRCDGCPGWAVGDEYPAHSAQNDPVLLTPPCTNVSDFLVAPDGQVLHRCLYDDTYYDNEGSAVYQSTLHLVHLGHGNRALARGGANRWWLVNLVTGVETEIVGMVIPYTPAIRAVPPSAFWVIENDYQAGRSHRWVVDQDANAAVEATYAPPPAGTNLTDQASLDAFGNLYQHFIDTTQDPITDVIIRYEADGSSSGVVYTEADDPTVKMHASTLFTGP